MKKKILLIEDSHIQLKSIELTLLKLNHEILTASNAIEGIEIAYQIVPDLIISDIIMPEINGYQFCRLMKNDDVMKKIPIILLTQLNEKLDSFWALKAGADCFITKSNNKDELLNQVNFFLNKFAAISEEERELIINEKKSENKNFQTRINNLLDQSLVESTIINEFRNLSEFIYSTKILSKELLSLAFSLIDFNVACIFFNERDEKKKKYLHLSIQNISFEDQNSILMEIKKDFFSAIFPDEYKKEESNYDIEIVSSITDTNNKLKNFSNFKSKLIIPISYANKIIGSIAFYHSKPERFNQNKIFEIIFKELKILMRIKWLYSETKYLAIIDGLTGLYNRRIFQQTLEREFARSKRHKTQLSLAMFDIDHFKQINDTYGHQFGDKVLAEIAKIIKSALRKTDYVARYGGEEIILILPDTNANQSLIPIERIRKLVEIKDFIIGNKTVKVTISCGVAEMVSNINCQEDLLAKMDKALYESKNTGRNKTTVFNNCLDN